MVQLGGGTTITPFLRAAAEYKLNDYLNHNLGYGETGARVESIDKVSEPDSNGDREVEYTYSVDVRILVGTDPETGIDEYEYGTEYRKGKRKFGL